MQNKKLSSLFNSISVWTTIAVPLVALLGFIPLAPFWVEGSKVLFIGILVSIAAVAYVLEGLLAKRFSLPHIHVLLGVGLYGLTVLVATLFAKGGSFSLFGIGIEAWTVTHIIIGLLYFIIVAIHAQNVRVRNILTYTLVFGALISVAFQFVRIFSLGSLGGLSIFTDPVTNTVGRWFDIGIVALLLTLASIVFFAVKAQSTLVRVVATLVFVASFVLFAVVSPLMGLILLAGSAFFVRRTLALDSYTTVHKNVAIQTLLVVSVFACAAFMFQGLTGRSPLFFQSQTFPTFSQTRADIVYKDFPATFMSDSFVVAKSVLQGSPIFGVGAARFQEAWAEHRPLAINQTAWWSTDFNIGSGILFTVGVMFGLLGLLGLLVFLFVIFRGLYHSLQSEYLPEKMFALLSLIVLLFALVQTPSVGLMFVMFTLIGITFSFKQGKTFSLTQKSHTARAIGIALLVLALPVYGVLSRTLALSYAVYAEQAVAASPARLLDAEKALTRAVTIAPHEVYYQALASVQQRSLADISKKVADKNITEGVGTEMYNTKLIEIAKMYNSAIEVNPKNYNSHLRRGQFLSNFVGQGNDSTSTAIAFADVQNARTLAPTNASIDILEAQLYLLKNDGVNAEKLLLSAITKKANYTDAALILSQLKIRQGNVKDALDAAEYAVRTNVNSSPALYIYGRLQFDAKNYLAAAQAFERIVQVDGSVPLELARLLADSYAQIGSLEQARLAYEEILKLDPNNTEVKEMLVRIQEAKSQSTLPPQPEKTSPSVKK